MKTRLCRKCNRNKRLSRFYKGKYGICILCKSKEGKEYRAKNKQKLFEYKDKWRKKNIHLIRNRKMVYDYGITLEIFNKILKSQKGVCAICKKPEIIKDGRTGKKRNLSVDHCHNTNKVRGLLCSKCNNGIGLFNDSIKSLKSAIKYLGKNK